MIDEVSVADAIKNNDTPRLLAYETEGDSPFIKAEDVIKFVEAGAYSRGGILDKIIFRVMPIKAKCRTYIANDKVLFGFVYIPLQYFNNYLIIGVVGTTRTAYRLRTSEPYFVVTKPPRLEFIWDQKCRYLCLYPHLIYVSILIVTSSRTGIISAFTSPPTIKIPNERIVKVYLQSDKCMLKPDKCTPLPAY